MAQKSGCLACHSIDKKVLGPAYKDVAAKYKGDKEDRYRSRDKGFYTKIRCDYVIPYSKVKYKFPYISFGKYYKEKLYKLEDNGVKY